MSNATHRMIKRPIQVIQGYLTSSPAMKCEATAISMMATARPMTRTSVEPLDAPATASTLSSDIDTSASVMSPTACQNPISPSWPGAASGVRLRVILVGGDLPVHLPADPQQQDAAGEHQADDGEQLHGDRREDDAQDDRGQDAPKDHPGANLGCDARGCETDDDSVVACQHQVDHRDVEEGDEVLLVPLDAQKIAGFVDDGVDHRQQVLQQPVHRSKPF